MANDLKDLRVLLDRLGKQKEPIQFSQLYPLSDLTAAELSEFQSQWFTLSTVKRQHISRALVELAEADFQVNFDAVFRFCLGDDDDQVRATAVDGLWEDETVTLVGPFLSLLRSDTSALVRSAAAVALGRFVLASELAKLDARVQARIMIELLTTFHLSEESIEVRRRALESAAYACVPEALQAIEMAYDAEDERMRLSAVIGMGRSCDRRWSAIVLAELQSTSAAMRYEAAQAAGEMAIPEAVPGLSWLLDDTDIQVRDAAIWALGQIGGEEAKQALLGEYEAADEVMRAALDDALAEQALASGELDLALYVVPDDLEDAFLEDQTTVLWSADEEGDDEFGDPLALSP